MNRQPDMIQATREEGRCISSNSLLLIVQKRPIDSRGGHNEQKTRYTEETDRQKDRQKLEA